MRTFFLVLAASLSLSMIPASATEITDYVGKWQGVGEGEVGATIRRGKSKPDWLVVDLEVGAPGCGGSVTVYGRIDTSGRIKAESNEDAAAEPKICRVNLELVGRKALRVDEVTDGGCLYYHGASCGFFANLTPTR